MSSNDTAKPLPEGFERQLREMNDELLVSSERQDELVERSERAEESLRLSEEQFRLGITNSPIPVIMHAEDGEVLTVSRSWTELTGYTREDADVIQSWLTKAYGFGGEMVRDAMQNAFLPPVEGDHVAYAVEFEITTREGEHRTWSFNASIPGLLADGRRFVVGMAEDITRRVQAEAALRESEAFSSGVVDSLGHQLAVLDRDGVIIRVNQAWRDFARSNVGTPARTDVGVNYLQVCHPAPNGAVDQTIAAIRNGIEAVLQGERPGFTTEYPCHSPTERRWFMLNAEPLQGAGGGAVVSHVNISERRQAELELRASDEFSRSVLESSPDCVKVLDADGRLVTMNVMGLALLEIDDFDNFCGREWESLWPAESQARITEAIAAALTGKTERFEAFSPTVKGTPKWWDVIVAPIRDGSGTITRLISVSRDITDAKRVEAALLESEDRFATAFNSSPLAITITSLTTGKLIEVNETFVKMTGYGHAAAVGRSTDEIGLWKTPEDRDSELAALLNESRIRNREYTFRMRDGSEITGLLSAEMLEIGGEPCALTVIQDITERKLADTALRESDDKYRRLFHSIDEGVCTVEIITGDDGKPRDYRFLEYNPMFEKLTGLTDAKGKTALELLPDLEDFWVETYGRVAMTGEPIRFENYSEPLKRWFDVFATRIGDEPSRKVALVFRNITEIRRAETNLVCQAEVNQALTALTGVDEIMQTVGAKMGEYLNLSICAFIEVNESKDEAVIKHAWHHKDAVDVVGSYRFSEYLTDDFAKAGRAGHIFAVHDTTADRRTDTEQYAALKIGAFLSVPIIEDGEWKFSLVAYHAKPHDWPSDEIELIRSLTTNIWTRLGRARAETALRESEEKFRILSEASPALIWFNDPDGNCIYVNQQYLDFSGKTLDEIEGTRWHLFLHPEDQEAYVADFQDAQSERRPFHHRARAQRRDGAWRWIESFARPLFGADGTYLGHVGVSPDISATVEAEAILHLGRENLELLVAQRTIELAEANENVKSVAAERLLAEKERVRLLNQIVTTQEDERRRIARDLHDELGQQLTALRLKLESAKEMCDDQAVCDEIDDIQKIAGRLDTDVSFLARELHPARLDENGLAVGLSAYVKEWSRFSNVVTEFHAAGLDRTRLSPEIETNLYRIAQEALNNTRKHSKAKNVSVLLEKRKDGIILIIEDDGVAFDTAAKLKRSKGLGLIGMHERAALLGGTLEIESSAGSGTTIFVRIPNGETG